MHAHARGSRQCAAKRCALLLLIVASCAVQTAAKHAAFGIKEGRVQKLKDSAPTVAEIEKIREALEAATKAMALLPRGKGGGGGGAALGGKGGSTGALFEGVKRVAICVSGFLRTMSMSTTSPRYPPSWLPMKRMPAASLDEDRIPGQPNPIEDIPGNPATAVGVVADSVHKNLFKPLEKYGFDVYMVISTRGKTDRTPAVNDTSACEPLRPKSAGNGLFCAVPYDIDEPPPPPPSPWQQYFMPDPTHVAQLNSQMRDQARCVEMMQKSGRVYSHLIRTRPDVAMMAPLPPLESMPLGKAGAWNVLYGHKHACCCGNEDWFGIGTSQAMIPYLNRYTAVHENPNDVLPASRWNDEIFVKQWLARHHTKLEGIDERIQACIVKPTDRHGGYGAP